MGKPIIRLNPKVDSIRNRVLHSRAIELLLSCVMLLPEAKIRQGRGRRRYDYRLVLVLSIMRVLLNKHYADYESQMRTDKRILDAFGVTKLPCKSTLNNYDLKVFTLKTLILTNKKLTDAWVKKTYRFGYGCIWNSDNWKKHLVQYPYQTERNKKRV